MKIAPQRLASMSEKSDKANKSNLKRQQTSVLNINITPQGADLKSLKSYES